MPHKDPEARKAYAAAQHQSKYADPEYRARIQAQTAGYHSRNKDRYAGLQRNYRSKRKAEAIAAYGGCCACCGETAPPFLTIDHVDGGGNQERRHKGIYGTTFYAKLRREGYPPDYQVLCFNCNLGRSVNGGICPHQEGRA